MDRVIKFRAWDSKAGKMITPATSIRSEGSSSLALLMDFNGKCSWNNPFGFVAEEPAAYLKLMQWTGLTDKAGVDIYEGDIVNYGSDKNMVVIFHKDCAGFGLRKAGWMHTHFFGESIEDSSKCEVVGNIYDNPELLNTD